MASEDVIARLTVEGEQQFTAAMGRARGETQSVGEASTQAGADAKKGAKGLLSAAAAAAVMYKGFQGLKGAINTTSQLAKDTSAFARASGLSTKESQAWVVVAQQRGIQTKQLQVGMATLGRNLGALGGSTKASSKMFDQLGLSQTRLLKMPMQQRMAAIADAFSKLPDGANKAALAQRLFGRAGQQLLPILNEGGDAMTDQLDAANRLVPPLGKNGKAALDLAKQQRTLNMAMTGLKVTVGSALIPILGTLVQAFTPILTAISTGLRTVPGLSQAIVVLGTALGALLILNKVNAALQAMGIATKGLSLTTMGWVGAIVAVVMALVIAYQKVGWFRDFVDGAFRLIKNVIAAVVNWVKANWPLLFRIMIGPIGNAVLIIIKNFDKIKAAFTAVKNWIGARIKDIVGFFGGMPSRIGSALSGMGDAVKNAFASALNWVIDKINWLIRAYNNSLGRIPGTPSLGEVGRVSAGASSAVQAYRQQFGQTPSPAALRRFTQNRRQTGGLTSGLTLVGERGPELATFPAGTRITPLPPPQLAASQLTGGGDRNALIQLSLDGRVFYEAMARIASTAQAAR